MVQKLKNARNGQNNLNARNGQNNQNARNGKNNLNARNGKMIDKCQKWQNYK